MDLDERQVRNLLWDQIVKMPHGSQAEWARRHRVSLPYVNDFIHERRAPGDKLLAALGLEKIIKYRKRNK